jgi:hypothetical protein
MKVSDSDGEEVEVKSCCVFTFCDEGLPSGKSRSHALRPFRDPAALLIFQRLAHGLRQEGYEITEPKHGDACDAIMRCKLNDVVITLVINGQERKETVEYRLLTWRRTTALGKLLGRDRQLTSGDKKEWNSLCLAIGQELQDVIGATTVIWLTRRDAEIQWSKAGWPR